MLAKIRNLFVLASILALIFIALPTQAYAAPWGHHRGYYHHERYPYGRIVTSLPGGFVQIGFGGHKYFFQGGLFYAESDRRYVVVPPPQGVIIYDIPVGWHEVVIDGRTYYSSNGVYYARVPRGYQVVQPPEPVVVEPAMVAADTSRPQQQEFTVNIPDTRGSYVSVVLKRSGAGFVGPQGEFYPEFPKVSQLQAMYVK